MEEVANGLPKSAASSKELTKAWTSDKRDTHLASVVENAIKRLRTEELPPSPPSNDLSEENESKSATEWYSKLYKTLVLPHSRRLVQAIRERISGHRRFLIAFDECTLLGQAETLQPSTKPSLISLQRIIKAADAHENKGFSFWYILLDTSASISKMYSIRDEQPGSYRLGASFSFLPSFTNLGFDQMAPRDLLNVTPSEALEYRHLKLYGRPVGCIAVLQ